MERLSETAHAVLDARQGLWRVLVKWESVMDGTYSLPCLTSLSRGMHLNVLEAAMGALQSEVKKITVCVCVCVHVSEFVCVCVCVCVTRCVQLCTRACVCCA